MKKYPQNLVPSQRTSLLLLMVVLAAAAAKPSSHSCMTSVCFLSNNVRERQRHSTSQTSLSAQRAKAKKKTANKNEKKKAITNSGFGTVVKWDDGREELRQWLLARGADVGGVRVTTAPSGLRGVVAARDFAAGDVLFSIPRDKCILDETIADASPIAVLYPTTSQKNALPPSVRLALYLFYMKKIPELAKEWQPYLAALPQEFESDGGPMEVWTTEEVLEVECGQQIAEVHTRKTTLRVMYEERIFPQWTEAAASEDSGLFGIEPPTFEEFQHEVVVCTSRTFGPGEHVEGVQALLVPGVDMCNHDDPPVHTRHALSPWGEFVVLAHKPIAKGKEINLTYGAYPNRLLLAQYGFMLGQKVATDTALVRVDGLYQEGTESARIPSSSESEAAADEQWSTSPVPIELDKLRKESTDPNLRTIYRNADTRRINRWQSAASAKAAAMALSENEAEGKVRFRGLLQRELNAYSTSIEEDENELQTGSPSPRKRWALSFRILTKRLLEEQLELLDAAN
jgi:hypothetical protein